MNWAEFKERALTETQGQQDAISMVLKKLQYGDRLSPNQIIGMSPKELIPLVQDKFDTTVMLGSIETMERFIGMIKMMAKAQLDGHDSISFPVETPADERVPFGWEHEAQKKRGQL